jgi:hypothetical protein
MPIPPNIDLSLIREAMARRASGEVPAGGAGVPAMDQLTIPQAATPTGGANTPTTPVPQANQSSVNVAPKLASETAGAAQAATGPNFDDETKMTAKALIAKLLKVV